MTEPLKPIKPNYGELSAQSYIDKINSPSRSKVYFESFHQPVINEAKAQSADGAIVLLNLACGHAFEMDFLGEPVLSNDQSDQPIKIDPSVRVVGFDIDRQTLVKSARNRFQHGDFDFLEADTQYPPLQNNIADVGIVLNAVVYKPNYLMKALFDALKPGKKAVVNFRAYQNPYNQAFYDYYLKQGGKIIGQELVMPTFRGDAKFDLKVLDYRQIQDPKTSILDRQVYFQSLPDIERFIEAVGFNIIQHDAFHFKSPANPDNEIDVFTLQKPAG